VKKIIYIVGPTGVGKTKLVHALASFFNLPIISMDSMQIYKYLNIGTAKPSAEEIEKYHYYGINLIDPSSFYSTGDYLSYVHNLIRSSKYKAFIVSGGTGLYYNALTDGFSTIPSKNSEIRKKLNEILENDGIDKLYERLFQIDKPYAEKIGKNDPQRLIRALEVYELTGVPFSKYHLKRDIEPLSTETLKIGLYRERAKLYQMIDKRVDDMVKKGFFDEAKALYDKYGRIDNSAFKALGYNQIFDFFEGKLKDKSECIENIKKQTRNYAKRQMTWFRRDQSIHWFFMVENLQDFAIAKKIDIDKIMATKKELIENGSFERMHDFIKMKKIKDSDVAVLLSLKNIEIVSEDACLETINKLISDFIRI
jgi:tRNA dimethylallyltransferase